MLKKLIIVVLLFTLFIPKETKAFNPFDEYNPYSVNELYFYNFFSTHFGIRADYNQIDPDAETLTIYIPYTDYNLFEKGGIDSKLVFYDDSFTEVLQINFADAVTGNTDNLSGEYTFDLSDPALATATQFTFWVMQSWESLPAPAGLYNFINESVYIKYDDGVYVALYFVDGEIYEYRLFDLFVPTVDDPPPVGNEIFSHWAETLDYEFNFNQTVERNIILYAVYISPVDFGSVADGLPNIPNGFQNLMLSFGLYNTSGFILIFTIVIFMASFGLIYLKLDSTLIIVINIVITGIFIFSNLLPFWAWFTYLGFLIVALLYSIKGGVSYE